MNSLGLYINDLSMHDSSRDLVLAGTQQSAELKLALDQVWYIVHTENTDMLRPLEGRVGGGGSDFIRRCLPVGSDCLVLCFHSSFSHTVYMYLKVTDTIGRWIAPLYFHCSTPTLR